MNLLKKFWVGGTFLFLELILFITNYRPGTYLAGWDGLYPELNFPANLQRNVFALWQEYRGVGLYDGMSYASNLVHTLFIWLLSLALPQDLLRYTFIFLMHGLGVVGMYLLLKKLLRQKAVAILGALFYGFNLGIIQMFYAPLEVFAVHFAFLPLLVWSLLSYLHYPERKKLGLFALFSFLATPQGYVPQIFISYLFVIIAILGVYLWYNKKTVLPTVGKVLAVIFCINAFWLLPYVYGIPQNAPVIMNSKINQMASNKIYLMNKNRGNLIDVLTFKGFMLDTAEFSNEQYGYIMQEWRQYTATPLFVVPSIVFAILMLTGLFSVILTRNLGFYPFVFTGLISFFFLGNDIWGLNLLNAILRLILPVFNEAFRFPFTKFETLFAFSYTILFAVGLTHLISFFKSGESTTALSTLLENLRQHFVAQKNIKRFLTKWNRPTIRFAARHGTKGTIACLFLLLMFFCLPAFLGYFFFDSIRIKMEPEYKDIVSFLNTEPQTMRIATLPQPTFYNWEYHKNNYRGSGFIWYGISQATLERSFDPWSNYNENYYWELSQALYSHDQQALKNVFAKYQVGLVMLDENLIYPFAPKTLQFTETKGLLAKIGAKEIKHVGKVTLFALPASPLFAADNLPSVNPYTWGDTDTFYQLHGNYIADTNADFLLPFRSLFSNRSQKEIPVKTTQTDKAITLSTTLPSGISHITLPSFALLETFIQADLVFNKDTKEISFVLKTPQTRLDGQSISQETLTYPLFTLPDNPAFPLTFTVNDQQPVTVDSLSQATIGTFLIPTGQNTYVAVADSQEGSTTAQFPKEKIQDTFSKPVSVSLTNATKPFSLEVTIPKPHTTYAPQLASATVTNCNRLSSGAIQAAKVEKSDLKLSAVHADACLSFFDRQAQSNQGYLLTLGSTHTAGEPLSFWAEDPSEQYSFLYTQLPLDNTPANFFIPPREKFNIGYSFHLENISTGEIPTQNTLQHFSLSPIPYNFLTQIMADTGKNQHAVTTRAVTFTHFNPSLYDVTVDFTGMDSPTIVLSQAYDPGWHAYAVGNEPTLLTNLFPFLFGPELGHHVKVNNWENGWTTSSKVFPPNSTSVVIVFVPQYIEYFGLLLLIVTGLFFILQAVPFPQTISFQHKLFKKTSQIE